MKREFLANIKVGDQPLPAEVIDAIMAEHGRGVEAAKKPFADYDTIKEQLSAAQDTIKGFENQDIDGIKQSAKDWETKYNQAVADHAAKLDDIAFNGEVDEVLSTAKGKNIKAIKALMDMDGLKASKNRTADIKAAVEALQKAEDSSFLFGDEQATPPPYAGGTGTGGNQGQGAATFNFGFAGIRAKPGN